MGPRLRRHYRVPDMACGSCSGPLTDGVFSRLVRLGYPTPCFTSSYCLSPAIGDSTMWSVADVAQLGRWGYERCTGGLRQDRKNRNVVFHGAETAASTKYLRVTFSRLTKLMRTALTWPLLLFASCRLMIAGSCAVLACRPSRSPAIWWDQDHEPCFLIAVSRVAAPSAPITSRNTERGFETSR
ncbi:hypothetical protein LI328DRAFT_124758 [Trichoderma asperelloides]|nr:hypothetical protein LI328DRAFT_124758 [Trichoderma asperelloides]